MNAATEQIAVISMRDATAQQLTCPRCEWNITDRAVTPCTDHR